MKSASAEDIEKNYDIVLCTYRLLYSDVYRKERAAHKSSNAPFDYKFPVLEDFFWNRICYDEFHELEAMGDSKNSVQMDMLLGFESHYLWGLTATPNVNSVRGVCMSASLFKIDPVGIKKELLDTQDAIVKKVGELSRDELGETMYNYVNLNMPKDHFNANDCWVCGHKFLDCNVKGSPCAFCGLGKCQELPTQAKMAEQVKDFYGRHPLDRSAIFVDNSRRFVEMFIRQNSNRSLVEHIRVNENVIAVELTQDERLLYVNEKHAVDYLSYFARKKQEDDEDADAGENDDAATGNQPILRSGGGSAGKGGSSDFRITNEDLRKRARLLQLCAHFQLGGRNNASGNANEQKDKLYNKKDRDLTIAINKIKTALMQLQGFKKLLGINNKNFNDEYPDIIKQMTSLAPSNKTTENGVEVVKPEPAAKEMLDDIAKYAIFFNYRNRCN